MLAVVSLDGLKPIKEAGRLMLVYATNALNSGIQFMDKGMTVLNRVRAGGRLESQPFDRPLYGIVFNTKSVANRGARASTRKK